MHCFKMLLFLFSAIEITTLHTHITKFMPNVEAKKCWIQIFSLAGKLSPQYSPPCRDRDSPPHFKCQSGKGFFNIHSVLPLWDQGGMIFVSSARQGGNC